jgi:hypothetical protein
MTKITVETDCPDLERVILKALESWSDPTRVTPEDLQELTTIKRRVDRIDPVP